MPRKVVRPDLGSDQPVAIRGDAQWQDFLNPRNRAIDGVTPVGLMVTGATVPATHPIWGAYRGDHIYRLQVTGQGTTIKIYYSDLASGYPLNQGLFSVQVSQSSSGSGAAPRVGSGNCGGLQVPTCDDCDCQGGNAPTPAGTAKGGPSDGLYDSSGRLRGSVGKSLLPSSEISFPAGESASRRRTL